MDRSYLSNQEVVAASRAFVCVRLLTYESAEEGKLLESLFRGRDGLENSVFAILDPSGEKRLVRSGRGPSWAFRDAAAMAAGMQRIAERYPGKPGDVALPLLADVRRGLNAAAADSQPLAIVVGDGKSRDRLEAELARLAWSDELVGRFLYARASDKTDWSVIEGADKLPDAGVVVVDPGAFGTDGRVLATLEQPTIEQMLEACGDHESGAVDTRVLRRKGIREGIRWKTEIPVTDRGGRRR